MASTTTPPSARRAASSRRQQPAAHRRLADALAGADDGERRRAREPREPLRPHLGVRGHVGRALGERRAHEQEALAVADDGLVREVDEDLGARGAQRGAHAVEHLVRRGAARLHRVQPRHPDLGRQGGEPGALVAALPAPAAPSAPRSFSRPPANTPASTAYVPRSRATAAATTGG